MEFWENSFSGTSLPASVLLCMVLVYWLFVILGALDLDLFDFDLDFDAEADAISILSVGFAPLRFFNLGRVPLMLWMSLFSFFWWMISLLLVLLTSRESGGQIGLVIARDVGIALFMAKLATNPLRGMFDLKEPNKAEELIGRTCVMLTSEVSETAGQAEYYTDGAPLKLNVRAINDSLTKGDVGEIVDYEPEKNIFLVKKTMLET